MMDKSNNGFLTSQDLELIYNMIFYLADVVISWLFSGKVIKLHRNSPFAT